MKVYSLPKEVPAPEPDYSNYDHQKQDLAEQKHRADLKAFLIRSGFTGAHTGGVVSFPVADGRALYMVADGKASCLIHLPYGDAYQYRDAEFLPKKEILRRIEAETNLQQIFESKGQG